MSPSADSEIRPADPVRRTPERRAVIRYVIALTLVGVVLLTVAVAQAPPLQPVAWGSVAVLCAMAAASNVVPLRIHHGASATQGLDLQGAAFLALLLTVQPLVAVVAIVVTTTLVFALLTRSWLKTTFNAAAEAVQAVLGAAVFVPLVGLGDGEIFAWPTLLAASSSVVVSTVVSAVLVGELMRRLDGSSRAAAIHASIGPLGLVGLGVNFVTGVIVAALLEVSLVGAVFLTPLLVALFLGFRGYASAVGQTERAESMQVISRRLLEMSADDEGLDDLLERVRVLLSADDVGFVRATDAPGDSSPMEGRLADVVGSGAPRTAEDGSWMAAPVVLDGEPVGAVGVAGRRGLEPWGASDLATLATIADEIASAWRARQLLRDLRQERTQLQIEGRKLSDLLYAASDGILMVTPEGRVSAWNPAMELLTGLRHQEVVDRPWYVSLRLRDAAGEEILPGQRTPLHDALAGELRLDGQSLQVLRTDGQWRWLRASIAPVRSSRPGSEDEHAGAVLVASDVTAEREVDELRADFVATVSHELRTPLTPLRGFVSLLGQRAESLRPDQLTHIQASMDAQVARLEQLIGDLLVVAEMDRGELRVAPDVVRLRTLVEDAISQEAPTAEQRRRVTLWGRELDTVADAKAVARIVRGLVSNALKHSDGPVEVRMEERDGAPVIVVADHGPGIAPWARDIVFKPFRRLGDHLTRTQGPGLGLSIGRALAEAMGGALTLDEDVEVGARFVLTLPSVPRGSADRRSAHGRSRAVLDRRGTRTGPPRPDDREAVRVEE